MNVGNNRSLQKAKSNADDEWYTLRSEVEKGLSVFPKDTFKNKRVFCPCDGKESSFYTFFKDNFYTLGLKDLTATKYNSFVNNLFEKGDERGKCTYYDGIKETTFSLKGNGDFRSEEVKGMMKSSDIVVTNPPFSLAKDFMKTMTELSLCYAFIGTMHMSTYASFFPLLRDGKLWTGYYTKSTRMEFVHNGKVESLGAVLWWTNIPYEKGRYHLPYREKKELKGLEYYDNSNVLNVPSVHAIPFDEPLVAVPLNYLFYEDDDHFKIIDYTHDHSVNTINGKETFKHLILQNKAYPNAKIEYKAQEGLFR